jgi:hypothetical protein
MIKIAIDRKLFIYLTLGFIIAIIVGTLTHELGHFITAKLLGFNAHINYASTYYSKSNPNQSFGRSDFLLITLGGPIQTMLTGTIGLFFICIYHKSYRIAQILSFAQWIVIFISLFWLRQTANFFTGLGTFIFFGRVSNHSDELRLDRYLGLPCCTLTILTAAIGIIVLLIINFRFIPVKQRLTFILSGLTGGISGYILWLYILGPKLMP